MAIKLVRWKAIVPLVLFLALVVILWIIFADRIIRSLMGGGLNGMTKRAPRQWLEERSLKRCGRFASDRRPAAQAARPPAAQMSAR